MNISANIPKKISRERREKKSYWSLATCGFGALIRYRYSVVEGFTLVEMIGVLAGGLILALSLAPSVIRHYDRLAGEQEIKALDTLSEGLRNSIMRNRAIPSHTNWIAMVATELGIPTAQVSTNGHRMPRVFLIDPAFQVGTNSVGLPYRQNALGSRVNGAGKVLAAINPRLMILSSLSPAHPLPNYVTSGVTTNNGPYYFNNIWTTADWAIPAGWIWGGRAEDLKIQRLNLDDMFVRVTLSNLDMTTNWPSYAVDVYTNSNTLNNSGLMTYFIKSSKLELYRGLPVSANLEYNSILHGPANFSFEYGTWRGDALAGQGISQFSPADLQWAANLFLSANWNTDAQGQPPVTQTNVYLAMINYMSNFCVWRTNNYPKNVPNELTKAKSDLKTATEYLVH